VHFGTALQLSYISVAAITIATHPATFVGNAADSVAFGAGAGVVVVFIIGGAGVGGAGVSAGGAGVGGAGVGGMGVGILVVGILVGACVPPAGSGVGIIVGADVGAGVATVIVLETVARFPP